MARIGGVSPERAVDMMLEWGPEAFDLLKMFMEKELKGRYGLMIEGRVFTTNYRPEMRQVGELTPEKRIEKIGYATAKMGALETFRCPSTFSVRSEAEGIYGGGNLFAREVALATSGLPEHGDEVFNLVLATWGGCVDEGGVRVYTQVSRNHWWELLLPAKELLIPRIQIV